MAGHVPRKRRLDERVFPCACLFFGRRPLVDGSEMMDCHLRRGMVLAVFVEAVAESMFFLAVPVAIFAQAISAQGHLGSDGTLQQCETEVFRRFVCCGFVLCGLLAFSFSHPFVGSLMPGEVRGQGRSLVEVTSSDPISVSTPVLPRTVPDVDTVTDSEYVVSALNSIDTLSAGGAQSSSPRSEHAMVLDVETRIVEDDLEPTQMIEPVGKRKESLRR